MNGTRITKTTKGEVMCDCCRCAKKKKEEPKRAWYEMIGEAHPKGSTLPEIERRQEKITDEMIREDEEFQERLRRANA